jgi:hypothetical protein
MKKYIVTFLLENPAYEVEADDYENAEGKAFKQYLADRYNGYKGYIMDVEIEEVQE